MSVPEGQKMLSVDAGESGSVFITGQTPAGDDGQTLMTTWKFNRITGAVEAGWPRVWYTSAPLPPTIPSTYKGYGVCVLADGSGGCVVAGAAPVAGQGLDIVLVRYNSDGVEAASATWNYAAQDGDDYPVDMALDSVGGLWVAATSGGVGTSADMTLIGFRTTDFAVLGQGAAVHRFDGVAHKTDTAVAVVALPVVSGETGSPVNVSMTGTSYGALTAGTNNDIVTINYIWSNNVLSVVSPSPLIYAGDGGASNEVATSIAIAAHPGQPSSLDVFVCGYTDKTPARKNDYVILGYPNRADDPNDPWPRFYPPANEASVGDDVPVKVTVVPGLDSARRVVVTGTSWAGTEQNNVVTLAFTQPGIQLWTSIIREQDSNNNHYDDRVVSMTAVFNGNIYVVGKRYQDKNGDGLFDFDFMTYAIQSTDGARAWITTPTYNAPNGGPDGPAAIDYYNFGNVETPDVFVAGRSLGLLEGQMKYTVNRYKQD